MPQNPPNPKKPNNSDGLQKYARYSGIGFQMVAVILVFVFAGRKLDQKFNDGERLYIIIFSILGIFAALYTALKDFIKPGK